MKRYLYLAMGLLLLPAFYACGNQNSDEPSKKHSGTTSQNTNTQSTGETGSDEHGTDNQGTDNHGTDTQGTDNHGTDSQSTEDENSDVPPPPCPQNDPDFVGCLNIDNTDWLMICRDGVVNNSMRCYANEHCFKVGTDLRCMENVPTDIGSFCQISGNEDKAFCQTVGPNSWFVVCENGVLYQEAFGTSNCTDKGLTCMEITDAWGSYFGCGECKIAHDCRQKTPANADPVCLYGSCSFNCKENFIPDEEGGCIPDTQTSGKIFSIDFSYIENITVDSKQAEAYDTSYTYQNEDFTIEAVGRKDLTNTINDKTTSYAIDGAGIIIRTGTNKASKITITGLKGGVGTITFDAFGWDKGLVTFTLIGGDGAKSKALQVNKATAAKPTYKFNNQQATGFTIESIGRVVVDNLSWTEAASEEEEEEEEQQQQ